MASATRLDFINQTGQLVDILWIDNGACIDDGGDGMVFYARMRTGDNWSCDTHIGHQWVASAADTGEELGRWVASRSLPLVVLLPGMVRTRVEGGDDEEQDV